MILPVFEGIIFSFVFLLVCVIDIQNGPVGGVHFYEKDVQDRVVELGLISREEIRKKLMLSGAVLWLFLIFIMPLAVFLVNGAASFSEGFLQLTIIFLMGGMFDRIFIDWYWVGHTKAWLIPGTEDLMPYIPKSACIRKWAGTMIGYPLLAAILSWVYSLILL